MKGDQRFRGYFEHAEKYLNFFSVCLDYIKIVASRDECRGQTDYWKDYDNGTCYDVNYTLKAIWNQTRASEYGIQRTLPSEEYYE